MGPGLATSIPAAEKHVLVKEAALAKAKQDDNGGVPIAVAFLAAARKVLKDLEAKAERAVCRL